MKTLFKGIVRGTAITDANYGRARAYGTSISFIIELDEEISRIPSHFPVFCEKSWGYQWAFGTIIKKGDRLLIKGKIVKKKMKTWQKDCIMLIASNIYNENTKFGF